MWKYCENIVIAFLNFNFSFFILFVLYFFTLFFIHISFFFSLFFSPPHMYPSLFFPSTHVSFSFLFCPSFSIFPTTSSRTFQFHSAKLFLFSFFFLPFSLFSYHFICKFYYAWSLLRDSTVFLHLTRGQLTRRELQFATTCLPLHCCLISSPLPTTCGRNGSNQFFEG